MRPAKTHISLSDQTRAVEGALGHCLPTECHDKTNYTAQADLSLRRAHMQPCVEWCGPDQLKKKKQQQRRRKYTRTATEIMHRLIAQDELNLAYLLARKIRIFTLLLLENFHFLTAGII